MSAEATNWNIVEYFEVLHTRTVIYPIGLFCTLVCLFAVFKGKRKDYIWLLIPVLSYLIDVLAAYYFQFVDFDSNILIYNLLELPFLIFILYAFYTLNRSGLRKQLFLSSAGFLVVYHILYLTLFGGFYLLNTIGVCIAMIIVTIMAYLNLINMVETEKRKLIHVFVFWFSLATFISYIGRVPITALTFGPISISETILDRMYIINDILYIGWYLIITLGLILSTKWTKESTSP